VQMPQDKVEVARPQLEGSVAVEQGRRLGFASFGTAHGRAVFWLHGTPGARRQIPVEARAYAEVHDLRIIGIDRPGIGWSTAHVYDNVLGWTEDLEVVADTLGVGEFHTIGLSGGGPYALAAGAAMPDRVRSIGVLGGVAPTVGEDAAEGGLVRVAVPFAPLLALGRVPLSFALTNAVRLVRPFGGTVIDAYRVLQPEGDKKVLARPEFRAMFLDDILNGSRKQISAPLADLLMFTRHWGFHLADVSTPVLWWHGDGDHIVPWRHGEHCVSRLPAAELHTLSGESHLGGMVLAEDVLGRLVDIDA
jgi:pimeloyl-ACP methyl ester carboxylesterase